MLNPIQDLQLLEGNGVNLVQGIQAGNVLPVALYYVDNVVLRSVAFDANVRVVDFVLFEDCLDGLIIDSIGVHHS